MVQVFEGTDDQFTLDGWIREALDTAKKALKKDWDMVFVVDGAEGAGKSVLAQQLAKYCDPSFNIERITFDPDQFKEQINKAEKFQAVIFDEAYTGLSSRATMSRINKGLVKMMAEVRQKNLFVFVVMPTFFDLDKYVALWRSRALFNVYTGKNFSRGFVKFYNIDRKKNLYVNGKKFYNYFATKPNFRAKFVNHYTVDETKYKQLKYEALKKHTEDDKEELNDRYYKRLVKLLCELSKQGYAQDQLATMTGLKQPRISQMMCDIDKFSRV